MDYTNCPECDSDNIVLHTVRHNLAGDKRVFQCRWCKRIFVEDQVFRRMRKGKDIIIAALLHFNEGYSFGAIKHKLKEDFDTEVSRSTIFRWIKKYSKDQDP